MSRVAHDVVAAANHLFGLPETMEKFIFPSRSHQETTNESKGVSSIPVEILDSPKEYVFFMDVPGLSKSDIQVAVEDENTLVIRISGKRKREDSEEEGCKHIRLEEGTSEATEKVQVAGKCKCISHLSQMLKWRFDNYY